MKSDYLGSLFDLCASEVCKELSDNNKYEAARRSAYSIEMELRKECGEEQMKKIETLLKEAGNASAAESECLFEMSFNLGIKIVLNALK